MCPQPIFRQIMGARSLNLVVTSKMAANVRIQSQKPSEVLIGLTSGSPALKIGEPGVSAGFLLTALPPRSMVGQLPLEQHIGVRIPGGQPDQLSGS
jgi:hypothetical protein